jgi:hypothetical protein
MAHSYRDLPSAGSALELETGYAFSPIPGLTDISHEDFKRNIRTPTLLTSPAVVKKPGMPDFGTVKAKCFFDPNDTTHKHLRSQMLLDAATASANLDNWKFVYADGYATPANFEFTGFVSNFSESASDPETGTLTADLEVTITEITAFNDGSPAE